MKMRYVTQQGAVTKKLEELMKEPCDDVFPEYITVMVSNGKTIRCPVLFLFFSSSRWIVVPFLSCVLQSFYSSCCIRGLYLQTLTQLRQKKWLEFTPDRLGIFLELSEIFLRKCNEELVWAISTFCFPSRGKS